VERICGNPENELYKKIHELSAERMKLIHTRLVLLMIQKHKLAEKDYLFPPRPVILLICKYLST